MNRLVRPVMFAFEADVVHIYGRVTFGSAGAPTLDTNNSKGVCSFSQVTTTATGVATSGSTTVSGISSLFGVYNGMKVSGSGISGSPVISAVSPSGLTMTIAAAASGDASGTTLSFVGGQYRIQLGSQAGVRLDAYTKLLSFQVTRDEITSELAQAGANPAAPTQNVQFLVNNSVSIRTIPQTSGSTGSSGTDCSITFQVGTLAGSSFVDQLPASGSAMRFHIALSRSSAI